MARNVPLPAGVRELAGLAPVHYTESFAVDIAADVTPEQWARRALAGADALMRAVMVHGWPLLGIRLAPFDSPDAVLGWPILRNDPDAIVLGIDSALGLVARIVIQVSGRRLVHSMVVRYDSPAARAAWFVIAPPHRVFVRRLLDVAAAKLAATSAEDGRARVT